MSSASDGGMPTPSSVSHPHFTEPSGISFERPVLRVGRYRVLSELGRGGMANVYLAVAHGPGGVSKLVVLKALLPDLSAEPYALSMFLDEARLAAQLNHPNVVQTYEVGTEGDRHVIVMEYLEGQSLSAISKRADLSGDPLPSPLHLRVIINALEGLHYAHELTAYDGTSLDLVHRDVSPQNVFVTYDGQVKVLDFGIAKAATSSTHTATGIVKGKVAYMAPEQTVGDSVDRRADIYSIGCMLWAVATGKKLWRNTPDVHVMRRVINGDIPTPQSANPGCDDELNRIVMKALAPDVSQRYQTALELQHDLEVYAEKLHAPNKQKDIARYVQTLFADTRSELKALVERQLALVQLDDNSGSRDALSLSHIRAGTGTYTVTGTGPGTGPGTGQGLNAVSSRTLLSGEQPDLSTQEQSSRTWLWVGLAVLAFGSALGIGYFVLGKQVEPPAVVAPVAAPQPAPPARAVIQFRITPSDAKLFLDDQPLPPNLTSKVMDVDSSLHRLRVEAEGYKTQTLEFSASRDETLELTLAPATKAVTAPASTGEAKSSTPSKTSRPAVRPRPAATPVAPTPNSAPTVEKKKPSACDEPFYMGADGIRRMRPECM